MQLVRCSRALLLGYSLYAIEHGIRHERVIDACIAWLQKACLG